MDAKDFSKQCFYEVEHEFDPPDKACEVIVRLFQGQSAPGKALVKEELLKVK
jgi:hypothetical protein